MCKLETAGFVAAAPVFANKTAAPAVAGPHVAARGTDALAGGRLGHMVARHEKIEEGGVAESSPEPTPIDGIDVAQEVGVAFAIEPNQGSESREQRVIFQ